MYTGYGNIDYQDNTGKSVNMDSSNDVGVISNYSVDLKKTIPIEVFSGGVGINVKVLRSTLGDYSTEAFATDIGGIFTLSSLFSLLLSYIYSCNSLSLYCLFQMQ